MIQVRNVPAPLHEELKRRAARRGETLTAYIQGILEREVETLPLDEWLERALELESLDPVTSSAEVIREAREKRTEELTPGIRRR